MIELRNVSKSYKNNYLFDNLSYTFENGKKYLITGVNGAGKSVLLKMIVGYALPTRGQIVIDEMILGEKNDFIQNAGVSIDAPQFLNQLTGMENLLELASIRQVLSKEDIIQLADILNLDLYKKYKTYSLGMRQKLRIIQAIMEKPDYLILDEPFDGLDTDSKEKVKYLIDSYKEINPKLTLIFTSHDHESKSYADVILNIENMTLLQIKSWQQTSILFVEQVSYKVTKNSRIRNMSFPCSGNLFDIKYVIIETIGGVMMIIKDCYIFALGDNKESAIKVNLNEEVVFYTRDCFNNQITSEDYVLDHLDWDHINPATGPIYIEGAKVGDVLKVEILDIEL